MEQIVVLVSIDIILWRIYWPVVLNRIHSEIQFNELLKSIEVAAHPIFEPVDGLSFEYKTYCKQEEGKVVVVLHFSSVVFVDARQEYVECDPVYIFNDI